MCDIINYYNIIFIITMLDIVRKCKHVWILLCRAAIKEEERRKIETTGQKYNGPYYIGRP